MTTDARDDDSRNDPSFPRRNLADSVSFALGDDGTMSLEVGLDYASETVAEREGEENSQGDRSEQKRELPRESVLSCMGDGTASIKMAPRELALRRMQLAGLNRQSIQALQPEPACEEQESDPGSANSSDKPVERSGSKKTTLGGFTIIRNDDSNSDSSDDSMKQVNSVEEERMKDMENMNMLIDNEMSKVMGSRQTYRETGNHKPKLEMALAEDDLDEFYQQKASTISGGRNSTEKGQRVSKLSVKSRISRHSVGSINEDTIRMLFSPGAAKHMKPHHLALNRVVKHIFALDDISAAIKSAGNAEINANLDRRSSFENLWFSFKMFKIPGVCRIAWKEMSRVSHRIVTNSVFLGFFLLLTIYALFGPDLVALLGSREVDDLFVTLNTIIFFLFILELGLLISGHESYICTVPCALDLVAILSFIGDTALIGTADDDSITQSQLATQTRMTRLTRITRVARVTRLVPRILAMFRRNKTDLAKRLLERRLYRAFQFLDTDQDGLIASFDVKTFYLNVLQDCPQLFRSDRSGLLRQDAQMLINLNDKLEDEHDNNINYQHFCKSILATHMGRQMLDFHLEDIENVKGVWTLTANLSDSTALKVCIGILMLIILMNLLDVQSEDISAQQDLIHVHVLARNEHAGGGAVDMAHLCDAINILRQDRRLLYLFLDGRTYVDFLTGSSECLPAGILARDLDPFKQVQAISKKSGLRNAELIKVCWPISEDCELGVTKSMSLTDNEKEVKSRLMWSTLGTAVIILIILIFITLFNRGISKFSRTTLHPLRALVDDMMAISSLELINIDADMPVEQGNGNWMFAKREEPNVEELLHLQTSFKSMRGAIRSWSRYVPPSVVQRLFSAGIEATIGVSRVTATILFIDVYDFEDACQGLSPNEVNNTLGSVLGRIALVIQNNRGTLLEFIGDEVLAVFNTPSMVKTHIYSAVASALEIHARIAELPPIVSEGRETPIRCRCGVHTAVILAGNIGSHRRMKYGLLGDGVNLSARLKGINTRYRTQTLCSENVKSDEYSARRAVFRPLDLVAVKGKTEPTMVYEIMGFAKGDDVERCRVIKEASSKHAEAFRYYFAREFRRSKALFDDVAASLEEINHNTVLVCGRDEPARQLRRRCQEYIRRPPGPEWDGVERLTKKIFELERDDDSSLEELTVTSEAEAIKSKSTADITGGGSQWGDEDDVRVDSPESTPSVPRLKAGGDNPGDMDDASSSDLQRAIMCPCGSFNTPRSELFCQDTFGAAPCMKASPVMRTCERRE